MEKFKMDFGKKINLLKNNYFIDNNLIILFYLM